MRIRSRSRDETIRGKWSAYVGTTEERQIAELGLNKYMEMRPGTNTSKLFGLVITKPGTVKFMDQVSIMSRWYRTFILFLIVLTVCRKRDCTMDIATERFLPKPFSSWVHVFCIGSNLKNSFNSWRKVQWWIQTSFELAGEIENGWNRSE